MLLIQSDQGIDLFLYRCGQVLENGKVVMEGTGEELIKDPHLRKAYLGLI